GEMVTINAGIPMQTLEEAAEEFFPAVVEQRIFPEMLRLARELAATGCEVWAVSSTNDWVIREGVKRFGIRGSRVLAASVYVEDGRLTNRLGRVPRGTGKVVAIKELIGQPGGVCFGNSIHDMDRPGGGRQSLVVDPDP